MIKKFLFAASISMFLLGACTSGQKKEEKVMTLEDSVNQQIKSERDRIVDELAPPDSDYTGELFQKYETGVVKTKGFFRFGKRHGQWFYFYPNGYIWSEALYDNGKMNGHSKVYYENGRVYYEGNYKQDVSVGTWLYYDTSGTLAIERTYDSLGKVLKDKNLQIKK
ncbi:MAG: toxin-antitoxin system YwqK family antitoxin [Bacteroidia bacterium]